MTTAWDLVHLRTTTLRRVVHDLEAGADLVPTDVGPVATAGFTDLDDLLLGLHDHWARRLHSRIDIALELDQTTLRTAVVGAWSDAVADLPGVRRVLEAYADRPALRRAELSMFRAVAVAGGLAALGDPAAAAAGRGRTLVGNRGARLQPTG